MEETIAALHEELQLTLNYAHAMVRDRNYRAAAAVIEEQRQSLVRATHRMEEAVSPEAPERRRARIRVALAGVAASLALASGAFAAFGPQAPTAPVSRTKIEAIRHASDALAATTTISDPAQLQQIVVAAKDQILAVAQDGTNDPAIKQSLLDSVRKLRTALKNPNVPAKVREEAQRAAQTVQEIIVEAPETEEPSADTEPTTPSAEASV